MRDTNETRRHYAEIAANWIKDCTGVTVIEFKRHTQNPRQGWTPYFTPAIRDAYGNLVDIDVGRFLDLLEADCIHGCIGLFEAIRGAGYTVYNNGNAGLVIINKLNPLLKSC